MGNKSLRVLVTGHAGYLGTAMVPILRSAGHQVVGLDVGFFEGCDLGHERNGITAIRKDVRDVESKDLKGFDAVIHLAALCNDPLGELNPELTLEINHHATVRLARLAKDAGTKRFLYSSSCSIYGASGLDDLLTEEAPMLPITAYGTSKSRAEEDLSKLAGDGFSPVFMRNATAYGVSPRFRGDVVLNNLVGWAFTTGKVRIMSDGTPWRPLVHVEDIAMAFAAALTAPLEAIHNQAFNVGIDADNYQIRDLASVVQEVVPGCTIEYAQSKGPDPRSYRVDFSKLANNLPGATLRWGVNKGARQLYTAFQGHGLLPGDLHGRRFNRLAQLRYLIDAGFLDASLRWRSNGPASSEFARQA